MFHTFSKHHTTLRRCYVHCDAEGRPGRPQSSSGLAAGAPCWTGVQLPPKIAQSSGTQPPSAACVPLVSRPGGGSPQEPCGTHRRTRPGALGSPLPYPSNCTFSGTPTSIFAHSQLDFHTPLRTHAHFHLRAHSVALPYSSTQTFSLYSSCGHIRMHAHFPLRAHSVNSAISTNISPCSMQFSL